jgi:hypothetical protein
VVLTANDPADDPVAWSLSPLRSAMPIKITRGIGLNAHLGFIQPTVDRKVETPMEEDYVIGLGDCESDFEWRFTATRAAALVGIQRMFAVVKVRKGVSFDAAVVVAGTVRRPRLGLLHFNAELPGRREQGGRWYNGGALASAVRSGGRSGVRPIMTTLPNGGQMGLVTSR